MGALSPVCNEIVRLTNGSTTAKLLAASNVLCKDLKLITARKRSLQRLCFYTCLSVILFTGGGCLGPHPRGSLGGLVRGVSRPTPRGRLGVARPTPRGKVGGSGRGDPGPHLGGCPGPHLGGGWGLWPGGSRPTPRGGVSQHALRQTHPTPPPSIRLLLRAVRILIECILVNFE